MIAVIGAGITGLALAHGLRARGLPVRLFEAAPRAGGVIRSTRSDGFLTEAGPNAFVDREPAMRALISALKLEGRVRVASPAVKRRFLVHQGALAPVPGSPPAFLRSPLLPLPAKLRVLVEVFTPRAPPGADESVSTFFRRHLGPQADALVDAIQLGVFAGDPDALSLPAAFPSLAELERTHRSLILGQVRAARSGARPGPLSTFDDGMEVLPRALAESLGDALQLGTRLERLERTARGWRLGLLRGQESSTVEATAVVLALPAPIAARLLHPVDAPLAAELEPIHSAPVSVVHLGYARRDLPSAPEGFGFLAPERERRRVLGCIYASSAFPHRAPPDAVLLTCLIGGARHPELAALDDAALVAAARDELKALLGISAAPLHTVLVRWPEAIPQYPVGHLDRLRRIDARLAALSLDGNTGARLVLTGNGYRGVGVNDCVREAARWVQAFPSSPSA